MDDALLSAQGKDQPLRSLIAARVMEMFAPPHIVVDAQGDVVFDSGCADQYLEPQVGGVARQGMRLELRSALREAAESSRRIVRERIEFELEDRIHAVRLTVEPLPIESAADPLFIVAFTDIDPPVSREETAWAQPPSMHGDRIKLEREASDQRPAAIAADEQHRLLVAELNHRVRNMLQVVMGLANQTLHRSTDIKEFSAAFSGRMQALDRAYALLGKHGWHRVAVDELLRTQLLPFATEGERFTIEGAHCMLTADAALSFGLIIYELATNATKYGALTSRAGHVHVDWRTETNQRGSEAFILQWTESDGPAVKAPTRQGFGTELMRRHLEFELDGRAEMEFAETGLSVTLIAPTQRVLEWR